MCVLWCVREWVYDSVSVPARACACLCVFAIVRERESVRVLARMRV